MEGSFSSTSSSSSFVQVGVSSEAPVINNISKYTSPLNISFAYYFDTKSSSGCVKNFWQRTTTLVSIDGDGSVNFGIVSSSDIIVANNFKIYALLLN